MISDNLLYYIACSYNFLSSTYFYTLDYLEGLTKRVNKVVAGELNEWIIGSDYSIRKSDVAPVLLALSVGYYYVPETNMFIECGTRPVNDESKKFPYIGGEYKLNTTSYDITDWLNLQRWSGRVAPTPKQIIMAWLIKTNQLGFMMSSEWKSSECGLVDLNADDVVTKMMT
jgi:hypothetical protein